MVRPKKILSLRPAMCAALFVCFITVLSLSIFAQTEPPPTTDNAVELFNQGQDAHSKGDFAGAIDFYDKALKIVPEFAEAEYQKGNAFLSLGKKADAEAALRRAVELRSDWTLALAGLGTLLERRGEYSEAEKLLNKAILIDSSSFPAYSALVELKLKTGASTDTLKLLLEKVRTFTSRLNASAIMLSTQASLENATGDKAAAKKTIDRALSQDPNNRTALYLKADFAIAEGDVVLGEELIKGIAKIDADSDDLKMLRARLFVEKGQNDDAAKLLSSLSVQTPESKMLSEKLALSNEQSPDVLEKALSAKPNDAFLLGRLCAVYRSTVPEKSLDYCKRALDGDPKNINYAIGYGAALVQAKRYDEAVEILRRLSDMSPNNSTIHANLGTALFQSKRFAEAKPEYQWLTSHEPVPPVAYFFLAICHDQLGEYLDAAANYNLFMKSADPVKNQMEIDKVNLRLPLLQKDIKRTGGKSKNKSGV